MAPTDKIAIIGHNGWAAQSIINSLAAQAFTNPIRILARENFSTAKLPKNVEVVRYSWEEPESIVTALRGVDVLL